MKQYIPLGEVITKASVERCGGNQFPILSITMKDGLVLQDEKFKKRIASVDTSDYKVILRGKLVQGIHIDEANFGIQDIVDAGIVSPAYKVWDVNDRRIFPKYLEIIMRSPRSIGFYKSKLNGSVNRRGRMTDDDFLGMLIPVVDYSEQIRIVDILKRVKGVIAKREHELSVLDDLIKARFVEMFGDPVANPKGWVKKALSDEAEIRIGPFGSLLHKEDYVSGGHALVNPSHIINGQIVPDNELTVSDTKYTELLPYHLIPGDVVMGRRGEMGRCAVVEETGLLCGTGSLLIRTNGDLSADFIQKIISFPSFKRTIEDMAVGQTMPNLNVPIVSSFEIIKPPKSVQEQYYAFVAQIDKSKSVIQKSLDETQLLFDSLMQEYFG